MFNRSNWFCNAKRVLLMCDIKCTCICASLCIGVHRTELSHISIFLLASVISIFFVGINSYYSKNYIQYFSLSSPKITLFLRLYFFYVIRSFNTFFSPPKAFFLFRISSNVFSFEMKMYVFAKESFYFRCYWNAQSENGESARELRNVMKNSR